LVRKNPRIETGLRPQRKKYYKSFPGRVRKNPRIETGLRLQLDIRLEFPVHPSQKEPQDRNWIETP